MVRMPGYEFSYIPLLKRIRDQAVVNVNIQKHDLHDFTKKMRKRFLNEINTIVVDILVDIMTFRVPVAQWY